MAETHDTPSGTLQCVVVTPEATVLNEAAEFVAVPLYDGELGIAPLHTPLLGRLGYGELRIRKGESTKRFYVDAGFVEVVDDVVTVLTNRAMPADQVDPAVAAERLSAALARPAHTPELMEIRDRVVAQSRAQMRIAGHGK
jgi:F-type H+-transporting ATPase subunit epsilon